MTHVNRNLPFLRHAFLWRSTGYSLIELVTVVTIVGVLALIGWNRLSTLLPMYQLDGAARSLAAELSKTRARAVAEGRCFQIVFDTAAKTFQKQSKAGTANCGTTGFSADDTDGAARQIDPTNNNITIAKTADPVFGTRGGVSTPSVITLTNSSGAVRTVSVTSTGRVVVQ